MKKLTPTELEQVRKSKTPRIYRTKRSFWQMAAPYALFDQSDEKSDSYRRPTA